MSGTFSSIIQRFYVVSISAMLMALQPNPSLAGGDPTDSAEETQVTPHGKITQDPAQTDSTGNALFKEPQIQAMAEFWKDIRKKGLDYLDSSMLYQLIHNPNDFITQKANLNLKSLPPITKGVALKAFQQNCPKLESLRGIDFSKSLIPNITNDEFQAFFQSVFPYLPKALSTLNFSGIAFTPASLNVFAANLPQQQNLKMLIFDGVTFPGDGKEAMTSLSNVLKDTSSIKALILSHTGAESIQSLTHLPPQLQSLDLSIPDYDKDFGTHIAQLIQGKPLTSLDLENVLSAGGLQEVLNNLSPSIGKLDLKNNPFGNEGLQHLIKALPKFQNLTHLDIQETKISFPDIQSVQPLIGALRNSSVTHVFLSSYSLQSGRVEDYMKSLNKDPNFKNRNNQLIGLFLYERFPSKPKFLRK